MWRLGIFWKSALEETLIGIMRLRGAARVVVWQRRMQMSSGKPCVSCRGERRWKGILLLHVCASVLESARKKKASWTHVSVEDLGFSPTLWLRALILLSLIRLAVSSHMRVSEKAKSSTSLSVLLVQRHERYVSLYVRLRLLCFRLHGCAVRSGHLLFSPVACCGPSDPVPSST